jgi:hypothetical protein
MRPSLKKVSATPLLVRDHTAVERLDTVGLALSARHLGIVPRYIAARLELVSKVCRRDIPSFFHNEIRSKFVE